MTKFIYLLDPETGIYVGESLHPLDPVASERAGEPVYAQLNPVLAVEDPPPALPAGMRARRLDASWTLEAIPSPPEPEAPSDPPPGTEPPAPAPTFEERLAALRTHVQDYMDAMARALGYDDIKSAVTYADEPAVPRFQAEGRAFRAWRSLVWEACYDILARVQASDLAEPSAEALNALLPPLEGLPDPQPAEEPAEQPVENPA